MENYSPVVDLRSSRAKTRYDEVWHDGWMGINQAFNQNTTIYFDKPTLGAVQKMSSTLEANNHATITIDADITSLKRNEWNYGVVNGWWGTVRLIGNGKFVINANINPTGVGTDNDHGFFTFADADHSFFPSNFRKRNTTFLVNAKLVFRASGNLGSFLRITTDTNYGRSLYELNSPYIEIDMDNNGANKNTKKYVLHSSVYSGAGEQPTVFFNANTSNPSQADSQSNILKLTGNLETHYLNLYAHFTNSSSFLKGSLELNGGSSFATFSNGSSMIGNIDVSSNGNHSITFDNASFIGVVKNSATNGNSANGVNTTITFKNTAGKTFGDGTNDIVASSYKGTIIGNFDVSANSATIINGGNDGSKGFLGSGTNTLTFDFRNNASSSSSNSAFTIGGGNANSVYVMNAFQAKGQTELDLSSLSTNGGSLFSKIKNAGIAIKEGTTISSGANTNNVLQGTLLFKNTNIKVGNNGQALFATKGNILATSTNDLNGLALGAMFGNATWNDANKDGYITSDEITANAGGANYKLIGTNGATSNGNGVDDRASTGNIGKDGDNVKKQIGFIFANGTETNEGYKFGGDKQGYSGTIKGGTADSKYYFANAGYVNRTQIEDAKGDLVLFNTAFRGDLGVKNKDVSIMLDFSENRNGLRAGTGAGTGNDNANIVGAGSKNITFNFTGNTKKDKYVGAVVGDATKANANGKTPTDSDTATYTMLNLKKYSSDGQLDGDGSLKVTSNARGVDKQGDKTLIDAIQEAGLTNFNKNIWNGQSNKTYPESDGSSPKTDVSVFSTTNTTLALRGTSLDASNISFADYKYDFAFGSGLGEIEGVTIQDSKLKGTIDLSTNNNTGHKIVMRGDSIEGTAEIKFNTSTANFGSNGGGVFVYDDYTATTPKNSTPTLKLSGLSQTNYLTTGSGLDISKTNFEGDIWADNSVNVKLDFRDGRTWKMNESGMHLASGSNLVIHGKIEKLSNQQTSQQNTAPIPKLRLRINEKQGDIQLINTGAELDWNSKLCYPGTSLAKSLDLRGTSLAKVTYDTFGINGLHGTLDGNRVMTMTFASGSNLETIVQKGQQKTEAYYQITEEGINTGYLNGEQLTHTGSYSDGIYDGNYIADSYGQFKRLVTNSAVNITFIGDKAKRQGNEADWSN
ncbi:MAG TPA: hypothetical protein IAA23_03880, partial [Candidatus Helicobacter avistercoris]|nr:hypothetical protein [Candidatus Helicobacter avistercoris]